MKIMKIPIKVSKENIPSFTILTLLINGIIDELIIIIPEDN